MKLILFLLSMFFLTNTYAQTNSKYILKLNNITTPQEAKQVTDVIRAIINDAEEPFKNYPHFNDETDVFEFNTSIYLNREIIEEKMIIQGYEVIEFKTNSKLTPISE